ncbi:MAG: CcmD family protein [Acidobacteria bacterium]|nr:CcmD family protein [Acidobacteriota bacterium]
MKNFESLFAAYILVWGILFVYHLTVGARVAKLQQEIERLKALLKRGSSVPDDFAGQ